MKRRASVDLGPRAKQPRAANFALCFPRAIENPSHVTQLIDEFAMTPHEAAVQAYTAGDLNRLEDILANDVERDRECQLDDLFHLAVADGNLQAIDVTTAPIMEQYGDFELIVKGIKTAMKRGDRRTACHIWESNFGGMSIGEDDSTASLLVECGLLSAALEHGYSEIVNALIFMACTDFDYYGRHTFDTIDPTKFDKYITLAVETGDSTTWRAFADVFPDDTLDWAIENESDILLRHVALIFPRGVLMGKLVDAVEDESELDVIQLLHELCGPLGTHEQERIVSTAIEESRIDVLKWLASFQEYSESVPLMAQMQAVDDDNVFQVMFRLWGELLSSEQMERLLMRATKRNVPAVVETIGKFLQRQRLTASPASPSY